MAKSPQELIAEQQTFPAGSPERIEQRIDRYLTHKWNATRNTEVWVPLDEHCDTREVVEQVSDKFRAIGWEIWRDEDHLSYPHLVIKSAQG